METHHKGGCLYSEVQVYKFEHFGGSSYGKGTKDWWSLYGVWGGDGGGGAMPVKPATG